MATSKEPRQLVATACSYAASDQAADHELLARYLGSREFLFRLNEPAEYLRSRPKTLHVARVLKTLMTSSDPMAQRNLVALLNASQLMDFELIQELMVQALAVVRPSPPQVVAFWHAHSDAAADNLHLVIESIFANRSAPALGLFEQKMADPAQEPDDKVLWLRDQMLRARNDVEVLRCCGRMTTRGPLPQELKTATVEALCSYDREWYAGCAKPRPPARGLLSPEGKNLLTRICHHALEEFELDEHLKMRVELTLTEIGAATRPPGAGDSST